MTDRIPATGHLTWRQIDLIEPPPRQLVRAEGVHLHYDDGSTDLDACGGPVCVAIGYGRQEVVRAATAQMEKVPYGFDTPAVREFWELFSRISPGDLNRVFLCSGGSEAVEAAIRFTRHYHVETGNPSKHKIIARWTSYHGNSLGAASLTGNITRRRKMNPILVPFPHIEPCYCYRCPFEKTHPDCHVLCADKLEETILREGPDTVAAFIAEPLVGATAGVLIPPPDYFPRIREICDKYNVLLIADEVMTGFGRTGKWFAMEHWGVVADIMTMGKGITSGYMPMGAMAVREKLMAPHEPRVPDFGNVFTFSYHPVSAAVACAVVKILERENLVERSRVLGEYLLKQLEPLRSHPIVGDIRGLGLFVGVEIVRDRATREPFPAEAKMTEKVITACRKRGVVIYSGGGMVDGVRGDHVMITPPFVITEPQIDEAVKALHASLDEVLASVSR